MRTVYSEGGLPHGSGEPTCSGPTDDRSRICRLQNVASGTYAVSVLQELNGDNRVDTNWLGSRTEPCVSNNVRRRRRAPSCEEASFRVARTAEVVIDIRVGWAHDYVCVRHRKYSRWYLSQHHLFALQPAFWRTPVGFCQRDRPSLRRLGSEKGRDPRCTVAQAWRSPTQRTGRGKKGASEGEPLEGWSCSCGKRELTH